LELGEAWDDFGTVADVTVSLSYIPIEVSHDIYVLCQPFTEHFPRADIHELLAPDLLHQLIKGTFKDHLVTWIENYLTRTHPAKRAKEILSIIDQRSVSSGCC
jgi:hypothetical protein